MEKYGEEYLTYDDILLPPGKTDFLPNEADTATYLTPKIRLSIPICSAAMDTVTEHKTAITMAREGGIGFIHRNLSIEGQAREVEKVKKSESGMIVDPLTATPRKKVREVLSLMREHNISGVPVVKRGKLAGIVTNRDLRFETDLDRPVEEVMTKENLVTVEDGISLEEAKKILHQHRIEKLLVVDAKYRLVGLITIKDIEKVKKFPFATKDGQGRLSVGAAIGVGKDMEERTEALLKAGADVIAIDTSHGHSKNVIDGIRALKRDFPGIQLVAGNIATPRAARDLAEAGADAVKIGIGPGSICTTRIVAGIGVPQFSATLNIKKALHGRDVMLIADGGIKYSGDITKAIGAGAHCVMIGGLFAGTEESPGETVFFQGRSYKVYRGMGSVEAMKQGSGDRYSQGEITDSDKLVPEGIVGRVPYRGRLADSIYQLVGGLKSGMGYTGCRAIAELREYCKFIRITAAGVKEGHVHDVQITKEAPNYRLD